jgi:hypothetical protein
MPEIPNQLIHPEVQSHDDGSGNNGVGVSSQPLSVPHQPQQPPYGQQASNQPQWGQQPPQQWQQPMPPQQEWQSQPQMYPPPQYQQSPQYPPLMPPPPMAPKKPKSRKRLWLIIGLVVLVFFVIGSFAAQSGNSSQPTTTTTQATQPASTVQHQQPTTQLPTPTPRSQPTPTTVPTQTQAQIEADYKASTTSTTVTNLDKNGTADQGKDVHFLSKILNFVKDSTGNTAGANVTVPDSYSGSIIQVAFTPGTDITQLNEGDILEVWGTDEGVFSGTNAFGGTVQEVGITALYMFDQTTNYQANT